jgi:hypothetical protein
MNRVPLKMQLILPIVSVCWSLLVVGMSATAAAQVSLELALGRERVYPGEEVQVTVTLRVSDAMVRNIGYPHLADPAGGQVVFAPPLQVASASDSNVALYRFSGRIHGVKPGPLLVGPASLDLEIMEADSGSAAFFGAVVPRPNSLETVPVSLHILSLPAAGRPTSFSGAIGTFSMAVNAKPALISVGDPLTIITTINGSGNLDGVGCPQVAGDNLRSYPPTAQRGDDSLVCEQVVVPAAAGNLPSVVWSYFEPRLRRYKTTRQVLPSVTIAPRMEGAPVESVSDTASSPPASSFRRPVPPVWLLAMLGLTAAIFLAWVMRRRCLSVSPQKRVATAPQALTQSVAQLEQLLADGDVEIFYTLLFAILQNIVGMTSDCSVPVVVGILPNSSADVSSLSLPLKQLFAQCDRVRFGCFVPRTEEMQSDLALLHSVLPPFSS